MEKYKYLTKKNKIKKGGSIVISENRKYQLKILKDQNILIKTCIHIQTYIPHFEYANKLILSFLKLTNIKNLRIPIFITFDDQTSLHNYKSKYIYDYDLINFLNVEEIINNFHLEFTEKKKDLFKNILGVKWGAGGHRNYVAVKRIYSILELEKMGYDYVCCLYCESLVLINKI